MRNEDMDRVVPLNELSDFKVAEGDPDVRGWDVITADGRRVGEVDQLMVDTQALKVRYLDVDLEDSDRHVLVPIGRARLERDDHRVVLDQMTASEVMALPEYGTSGLTRDYETSLRQSFDRDFTGGTAAGTALTGQDFYAHDAYDDDRFYGRESSRLADRDEARLTLSEEQLALGKREVQAGEVEVHKRVETETVREAVPLEREEVIVERRPISDPLNAATTPQITEDEIRIPLTREEAVIEKRVVPTEELVVQKRTVTEQETVEAELRRERAEVTKEGDVDRIDDDGNRR